MEGGLIRIVILTYNGGNNLVALLNSIKQQKKVALDILIIDSSSTDNTREILSKYECSTYTIPKTDFNHGGTRKFAIELCENVEFVVFLTQDTILADDHTIYKLLKNFKDDTVGCVYGRQIPHVNSNLLAKHVRYFNYPDKSMIISIDDIERMGIRAAFNSDSFSAYRKYALSEVGNFPSNVICCEDMYVAAKMLLAGWKIAYNADAKVYHSHNYTLMEEYKRYYDIGVFHSKEKWIRKRFGESEKRGIEFILSEISFFRKNNNMHMLPLAFVRDVMKYIGYKIGLHKME